MIIAVAMIVQVTLLCVPVEGQESYDGRPDRGWSSRPADRDIDQIIWRAYLEVLNREPDPGSRIWVDKVLKDNWTFDTVVRALRDSDEYRRKRR